MRHTKLFPNQLHNITHHHHLWEMVADVFIKTAFIGELSGHGGIHGTVERQFSHGEIVVIGLTFDRLEGTCVSSKGLIILSGYAQYIQNRFCVYNICNINMEWYCGSEWILSTDGHFRTLRWQITDGAFVPQPKLCPPKGVTLFGGCDFGSTFFVSESNFASSRFRWAAICFFFNSCEETRDVSLLAEW